MPVQTSGVVHILNVGTKILLKDSMDQYLRSLSDIGDLKTHYASQFKTGLRFFQDQVIHVLIIESEFDGGHCERFLNQIGWRPVFDDLYVILAVEEKRSDLIALAVELEVNAVLVKPFTAADLKANIEKFRTREMFLKNEEPPVKALRKAYGYLKEKYYSEAEKHFRLAVEGCTNPIVFCHAAQYFLTKPDFKMAEFCGRKAIELRPQYAKAHTVLGQALMCKGQYKEAEQFLLKAQELSPLGYESRRALAKCYQLMQMEIYDEILQRDENDALSRLELAKHKALQKDYLGALALLERVGSELKPEQYQECSTFAALARKLGHIKS